jgi:hypothetical protein
MGQFDLNAEIWVDTVAAADYLGLRPPSLRAAVRRGTLTSRFKSPRRQLFCVRDLDRYRDEHLTRSDGRRAAAKGGGG